jgi:multidrug resistance protein, MATE family
MRLLKAAQHIFTLGLPMVGSQLIYTTSGFLCMTMLASLGHQVLAASALIFVIQTSLMVTGISVLFSVSVLVGHAHGANNYPIAGNYLQQGWTLALIMSLPIILLFWYIDSILIFFGQSRSIASIVHTYFHTFVWAVAPGLLAVANMQFGYGIQRKQLMFSISLCSVMIFLLSAYCLIFGKIGLPKLGVAGLGVAYAVQYSFSLIVSTLFFGFNKEFKKFDIFRYRVYQHGEYFIQMFKIGWPISVHMGGEMLSLFVSSILIGWLGVTALAAYQIVNQYYFLLVIPLFSLSQACGILVGHACGAKQFDSIKQLSHAALIIVAMISLAIACAFLTIPTHLAALYLDVTKPANAATLHLTISIFSIIAVAQFFDSIRNILVGMLRGLFDTRFPMYMSMFTIWVISLPLGYLLAFKLHFGAVGFALGSASGMLIGVTVMAFRWHATVSKY